MGGCAGNTRERGFAMSLFPRGPRDMSQSCSSETTHYDNEAEQSGSDSSSPNSNSLGEDAHDKG